MKNDQGSQFLSHYERYLGAPMGREIFERSGVERTLQILSFENVFPGCTVFASLGLTHFADAIGGPIEVVLPVDVALESVSKALANMLFFAIAQRISLGRGVSIAGLAKITPELSDGFGKEAIYLTLPFGFPDDFATVHSNGTLGRVFMAMFVSKSEHTFFMDHGCDQFESLLEQKKVDPFHLGRFSVV